MPYWSTWAGNTCTANSTADFRLGDNTAAGLNYYSNSTGSTTYNWSNITWAPLVFAIGPTFSNKIRYKNDYPDQVMRLRGKQEVDGVRKRINIALKPGEEVELEGPIYLEPGESYYTLEPLNETPIERRRRLARVWYQRKRQAEHRRREEERQDELKRQREQANKRAEELLAEYIGIEAFGRLHEVGYIEVDSQRYQGRKYRIPQHHCNDIEVLDEEGKIIDTLCLQLGIECPGSDVILARWILANYDEERLLSVANHHGSRSVSRYEIAVN